MPRGGNNPLDWLLQNTTHDFHVQHSKKRLGNRAGFALLDTQEENMEQVLRELLDIRGQIETLQTQSATLEKKNAVLEEKNAVLEKKNAVLEEKNMVFEKHTTAIRNDVRSKFDSKKS